MKKVIIILILGFTFTSGYAQQPISTPQAAPIEEFKIWKIPNVTNGAETYFSPDGKTLIYNGKETGDTEFRCLFIF